MSSHCPFCAVVRGVGPAHLVAESPLALAFLDQSPAADGHTLVVPRRHVESFSEVTPEEGAEVFALAARVAAVLRRVVSPGVTLHLAEGWEAGQDVPHTHLHVIPRRMDDAVTIDLPALRTPLDLAGSAAALRAVLERPATPGGPA